MSTIETLETRALALLQKLVETRKDDGQGMAVKVQDGDKAVELSLTAKPSQYSKGGPGGGNIEPRSKEEIEAKLKEAGLPPLECAVVVENGKVYAKWPYKDKDNPVMAALRLGWDNDKKARWAPLKGAPAPSP
jgi:hypothetical protein